ncbi:hypothetical protein GOP47_0029245 [Adiantum capillus-veneris]|nr:hypothetical protein GOP47_0029245 [Adiantum capillus-veneris]
MRDVAAHHVCPSDGNTYIHCMSDVERVMRGLGLGKTERFETSEGSWLRFSCSNPSACSKFSSHVAQPCPPPAGHPPQTPSEYAYHLKLPLHLHVLPSAEEHFRPFINAVQFFTGKNIFHLKKVDCEKQFCKYLTSCKELYGYQRAPTDFREY